jgi:hypothetical protein
MVAFVAGGQVMALSKWGATVFALGGSPLRTRVVVFEEPSATADGELSAA